MGQSEESVDQFSAAITELFTFYASFIHQHYGNIVADWIDATACGAFQALLIRRGRYWSFADRAN